jgi:hypothetical protein
MLLWSWPLSSKNNNQLISPPDRSGFRKLLRVDVLGNHIRCEFRAFSFGPFPPPGSSTSRGSSGLRGDAAEALHLGTLTIQFEKACEDFIAEISSQR